MREVALGGLFALVFLSMPAAVWAACWVTDRWSQRMRRRVAVKHPGIFWEDRAGRLHWRPFEGFPDD